MGTTMKFVRISVCAVVLAAVSVGVVPAQQNTQVKSLLQKFRNWRYGMVSVYKVAEEDGSIQKLNMLLGPKEPALPDDAKVCKFRDELEGYVLSGGEGVDEKEYQKWIKSQGCKAYEKYYSQKVAWEKAQFKKAFIVTTRRVPGESFKVIGLMTQKTTESYYGLKQDLDPPSDTYIESELRATSAPEGSPAATLYEFLENQIIQGNCENVTPEAQGIGEEGVRFAKQAYGITKGITEDNVQDYIRISEGMPMDYVYENEIVASIVEGVTFRHYERKKNADGEVDTAEATNDNLPKYGAELKYGLEEINYPSVFTSRMSLNALWSSTRLGVVLPTDGWASVSDQLGAKRTMTYAGMGVNGAFDFPVRVITESGVFNIAASYVFDDAKKTDYQTYDVATNRGQDYLIRFTGSLQYSFAIRIDNDFMFRLRLGGAVYGMETWTNVASTNPTDTSRPFSKVSSETIGSISGRVDFMTTSWSTPVGFSLSYFDETILGTPWLQVPIVDQFAIRFDAKIFAPIFRDPRPWERSSLVIPAVRLIYNF
ncbi:hypothetical protein BH10BAC6_BH10BAC6_01190 [soil metagenome]